MLLTKRTLLINQENTMRTLCQQSEENILNKAKEHYQQSQEVTSSIVKKALTIFSSEHCQQNQENTTSKDRRTLTALSDEYFQQSQENTISKEKTLSGKSKEQYQHSREQYNVRKMLSSNSEHFQPRVKGTILI